MSGINNSLLNALFRRKNQIDSKSYWESQRAIFPGTKDFEEFFQQSGQRADQLAKKILTRLCLELPFGPPPGLIEELAKFEEEQSRAERDKESYVPQDHLRHLVLLYAFGIYLFSFHSGIHNQCVRYLNRKKRNSLGVKHATSASKCNYRLFARVWTYFVLYHDLAYPLEGTSKNKSQAILKRIRELCLKDAVVRSLSRLLAIRASSVLASKSDECQLSELYSRKGIQIWKLVSSRRKQGDVRYSLENSNDSFLNGWKTAVLVTNAHTEEDLDLLRTIVADNDVCLVVENLTTGEPQRIFLGGNEYSHEGVFLLGINERQPVPGKLDPIVMWKEALSMQTDRSNEVVQVYIRNGSK